MAIAILDPFYLGISALICLGWQAAFFAMASASKVTSLSDLAFSGRWGLTSLCSPTK